VQLLISTTKSWVWLKPQSEGNGILTSGSVKNSA
jgi:hypothetical protein